MGDLRFAPAKEGTNSENERLLPVPTSSSPLTSDAASSQGHSEGIPLIKEPLSPSNKASGQRQSADQGTAAAASGTAVVVPAGKTSSSGASILASVPSEGKEVLLCRICLEDDTAANLLTPCGCTGTQRYAHKDCIQKWVDEKGHLRCEICSQTYQGAFTVPAQPTVSSDELPLFASIHIDNAALRGERDDLDDDNPYHHRNPAASWCATFVIFLLFLVVLHHTMIVADADIYADAGDGSSASGSSGSGTDADTYSASLTLFLFWVATKAFLIGIPLYTVMRIASRQARREQYEAYLRANAFEAAANRRIVFRVRTNNGHMGPPGIV